MPGVAKDQAKQGGTRNFILVFGSSTWEVVGGWVTTSKVLLPHSKMSIDRHKTRPQTHTELLKHLC